MTHDHRKLGVEFNSRTWDLIDQRARTSEEDREMVAAAHASYAHWSKVGTPANRQRGEATIARVYTELGQLEPALHHLQIAEELTRNHAGELGDFDIAFLETLAARVHALAANTAEAELHYARARRLGDALDKEEERKVLFDELARGPWYGFRP